MRITFTQHELMEILRSNGSIPEGLRLSDLAIAHDDLEYEVCDFELLLELEFDGDGPAAPALCALMRLNPDRSEPEIGTFEGAEPYA
jgi:hypothetical protein